MLVLEEQAFEAFLLVVTVSDHKISLCFKFFVDCTQELSKLHALQLLS